MRKCIEPNCNVAISSGSRCADHKRIAERKTTAERQHYGRDHRAARDAWLRLLAANPLSEFPCARNCGEPITVQTVFHLDHLPDGTYGISHAACNARAGGTNNGGRALWRK